MFDALPDRLRGRTVRRTATALVATLLVVTAASVVPVGQQLVVADQRTGETVIATPVHENSTVALNYTHSVQKTPVLDQYTVRDGGFVYTRMEFQSYGWGLPSRSEVHEVNGTLVLDDPDWRGAEIHVKPGRVADHELVVDGHTFDLVNRSNARAVTLRVTDRSLLDATLDAI
ncbi:DUF1850 domain-containing protein [Halarchaeum sp. P4]|uniref:DUF1850 domain-containing protein n=1 Tax=Halarchaeum sp. P4 TaxID=3421639 RepID=UPI003EB69F4C